MCLTTGLPEDGHGLAPKYTRFRVQKCFQKLFENCCRLSFLIGQRLFPEVILCLKSFFKVRHGLGVDVLIETDNFLNIFPEIFESFSKYVQKLFWSRNGSPWELWSSTGVGFAGNFKPVLILRSNRPWIATFDLFFYICWSKCWSKFCVFLLVGVSLG